MGRGEGGVGKCEGEIGGDMKKNILIKEPKCGICSRSMTKKEYVDLLTRYVEDFGDTGIISSGVHKRFTKEIPEIPEGDVTVIDWSPGKAYYMEVAVGVIPEEKRYEVLKAFFTMYYDTNQDMHIFSTEYYRVSDEIFAGNLPTKLSYLSEYMGVLEEMFPEIVEKLDECEREENYLGNWIFND